MYRRIACLCFALCLFSVEHAAHADNNKFDFKLPSLEEKSVSLKDFRGEAVVVVFWASWCQQCKNEIVWLSDYQAAMDNSSFTLVGIAKDFNNEATEQFVDQLNRDDFLVLSDEKNKATKDFDVVSLPATYIFDDAGNLVYSVNGFYPALKDDIASAIQQLH